MLYAVWSDFHSCRRIWVPEWLRHGLYKGENWVIPQKLACSMLNGEAVMCCCVLAHLRHSASMPINKIHPITSRELCRKPPWTLK
eukprot:scaffold6018_cov94-Skeletonema_dohrnii-CCMP3373.AAC.2